MSKKVKLINAVKEYKNKKNEFVNKVNSINNNLELTPEGKTSYVKRIKDPFEQVTQESNSNINSIIDSGIDELKKEWDKNSIGKLSDLGYQSGLANVIKMIESGAISDGEMFKKVIETYKDDYMAITSIRNTVNKLEDEYRLALINYLPQDNRKYNLKLLEDLKRNINVSINPHATTQTTDMQLDGCITFINDRLGDNLEII